ncbi:hypothetical protein C923_00855 [Plasmodium falciparum UGT5.1]|uniref:Uncharacterized protein n=1 Tax=Plasmodium falciparum UGT5.1 TaxID=1237627 RepID=W7JHC6_PLAFA|nr:hypothetical protein C923_00855 [Plasmodium falciparum UGT5.1]
MMIENDETLNELHNDEEFCIKEQLSHVDHDEKVHVDSIVKKSECAHNYEQREKRDRSSSVDSKPDNVLIYHHIKKKDIENLKKKKKKAYNGVFRTIWNSSTCRDCSRS